MTHYKVYSGDDRREERYERHTAILIQRSDPEEELIVSNSETPVQNSYYSPPPTIAQERAEALAWGISQLSKLFS